MLASVIGIVNPGTAASAILGILVCYCFCHVFEKRPFKEDDDNDLGIVLAWSLTLFFLSAICIKADLTQDSGDEQKLFGIALTVILATGPTLIVLQTLSALVQYFFLRKERSSDDDIEELDQAEKVNTLKFRRRQAPITMYTTMNRTRGSMSTDMDLEVGSSFARLPPKRLVEDRNADVQLEDLPSSVSKIWAKDLGDPNQARRLDDMRANMSRDKRTSRQSRSTDRSYAGNDRKKALEAQRTRWSSLSKSIDLEGDDDMNNGESTLFSGVSLDTGDTTPVVKRKSFTEQDLDAILTTNSEKVSLRQRLAVRKATFNVDDSEEHTLSSFKTRMALGDMLLPKRNHTFSPKTSPRPKLQDTKEEGEDDWGPMSPQNVQGMGVGRNLRFQGDEGNGESLESEAQRKVDFYEEANIKIKCHAMLEAHNVNELDRDLFKELIRALLEEDTAAKDLPSDKDLDWAFDVADTDQSGLVDEEEFVALYKLASAGQVKGLSRKSVSAPKKANFKKSFDAAGLPARLPRRHRASAFAMSVDALEHRKGTVADFLASIKMDAFWPEFEKRGYTMFSDFMDSNEFSDDILKEMGMGKITIQFFRRLLKHGAVQVYLKANDTTDGNVFSDHEVRAKYQETLLACAADELDVHQLKSFMKSLLKAGAIEGDMPSDQDLEQAFEVADTNKSNAIDENEALAIYKLACSGKVKGLSKANLFSSKKFEFKKSLKASSLPKQLKNNARQNSFRASKETPIYENGTVPVSASFIFWT